MRRIFTITKWKGARKMNTIFTRLIDWLNALLAVPCAPDPLSTMSPAELADLPISHPDTEPCGC
jgi:hypothetical protein